MRRLETVGASTVASAHVTEAFRRRRLDLGAANRLRGKDSNLDYLIQSQASYR
jgi:hypothetical protein